MLAATVIVLLCVMLVGLLRAYTGPSLYDRVLAANLFGTKTVLLIACISYLLGDSLILDIAVVYALINYISVVGVLRLSELRETPAGEHNE